MAGSRQGIPSWISAAAATRVDFDGSVSDAMSDQQQQQQHQQRHPQRSKGMADSDLGFAERSLSAAGAAVLSAFLVNPLDIAKVISCKLLFSIFDFF